MAEIVIKLANGEEAGRTLQEISKNLNKTATEMKKAEIGSKEFYAAQSKFKELKTIQEDLTKQTRSTAAASDTLRKSFGGILNQIPGFSQLSGALSSAKGGVGGLTSGFGMLRGAIIATGIGALIIAVTSLVSWFSKTEKGANMLSGVFKGMGAVLDTLLGKIWNIGDTLREFLANPIEFFKNLGKDIKNAAVEGYDFVQMMDELEDQMRNMEVTAKQNDILIDKLLLQAKNTGKTYEERLKLLNQANELTRKTYQEQLALSKQYLDAVEKEVAADLKRQGQQEMTDDQADKIKNAKLAYLDLLGQEIQTEEKIANRREQILGKQEKDAEKKTEKEARDKEKKEVDAQKDDEKEAARDQKKKDDALKRDEQYREKLNDQSEKWADEQIATAQKEEDFQRSVTDAKIGLQSQALGAITSLLGEDEKARKKNAEAIKAFTIAQIITDTQREIAGYFANPASTGTLGVVGTLKTIGALLRAGLAINRVRSQKFEYGGGVLNGPRHAQGGIPIEAEGGEFIFSRKAVRAIGTGTLNKLNSAYTFANGGPVSPYGNTGGSSAPRAGGSPSGDPLGTGDLKKAIMELAMAMDSRIDRIQVTNNLQDTNKGLAVLNELKSKADV
jgi:hypothetical protein